MDWASSEWKQNLSPLAVQKVNALEEKVQKLQKERDQKQIRLDWLTVELEKEQRKVETKNQDTLKVQKELQSIENVCKDLENKHQKLMAELQNRDSRIDSLEGLLSKAKQDNCKLQQLQKSLTDIKLIEKSMEKSKIEKSFPLEASKSKPSDLILFDEDSRVLTLDKENDKNLLNESHIQSKSLETLREKIKNQEALIKDLTSKLELQSHSEDCLNVSALTTPAKAKKDASLLSGRENFNFFDSFTSTPAKTNKERILKHQSDATVVDSGSDKIIALENRLKQLCQELDCQRHNFEATKNAMESKFKESENILKTELKFQVQACASLDKELNELKNKYQQETSQSSKKLDMITLQLNKSELLKNQYEQEIKRLETKLNDSEQVLRKKEEEFQELQKLKNVADMTCQSLQAQKSDLERKCNSSLKENLTLSDQVSSSKIELEKNINLLKEKDLSLSNMKKEMDSLSHSCNNLQEKIKELDNKLRVSITDYDKLSDKFEKLSASENSFKSLSEKLEREKAKLQSNLKEENSKSQQLELNTQKLEKSINTLQNQLENKALELNGLSEEMKLAREKYECSFKELQEKLTTTLSENASVREKLNKSVASESALKDNIKRLETDIAETTRLLNAENDKFKRSQEVISEKEKSIESMKDNIKQLEANIQEVTCQLNAETDKFKKTQEVIAEKEKSMNSMEDNIKQLEANLQEVTCLLNAETDKFKKSQEDIAEKEKSMKSMEDNIKQLETNLQEVTCLLNAETEKFKKSQEIIAEKEKNIKFMEDNIKQLETNLQEVTSSLNAETDKFKKSQEVIAEKEKSMKSIENNVKQLEANLQEVTCQLNAETDEFKKSQESMEDNIKQLEANIQEVTCQLNTETDKFKKSQEIIAEKEKSIKSMEENIKQLETNIQEVTCSLNAEAEKYEELQEIITEREASIKSTEELLAKKVNELKMFYEERMVNDSKNKETLKELEARIVDTQTEASNTLKEVDRLSKEKSSLENLLENLEKSKKDISDQLFNETAKNKALSLEMEELKRIVAELNENLIIKQEQTLKLSKNLTKEYEVASQDLKNKTEELSVKQKEIQDLTEIKLSLEKSLASLDTERVEISEKLAIEIEKNKSILSDSGNFQKEILKLEESNKKYEVDIKNLSVKYSDFEKENEALFGKNEQLACDLEKQKEIISALNAEICHKIMEIENLKEKASSVDKYEVDNKKLQEDLSTLSKSIDTLKLQIENQTLKEISLEEQLSQVKNEKEGLLLQFKETEFQTLETEYLEAQEEINSLKLQLKEIIDSEVLLRHDIACLQQEKSLLSEALGQKADEIQSLILSKEEISEQSSEICRLKEILIGVKKDYKAGLENALSEKISLTHQLEESSLTIKNNLEKIVFLEEEKLTLTDLLKKESQKSEMLAVELAQLKEFIFWIGEDLAQINVSAVQAELQYQYKIGELESSLLETQNDLIILRTQLEESQSKELHLSALLDEESKKSEKYMKFEEKSDELKNIISLLETNLSEKSHSLHQANETILLITSEYEEKIVASKNKLSLTLEECQVMKSLLEESLLNQDVLKEKIAIFENEKADIEIKMLAEVEKNISLEAEEKKKAEKIAELEDKLYVMSIDLEKEKKTILEKEDKVSELENRLEFVQSEFQQSFDQLQESICNEKILKEKYCLIDLEHIELSKSLEVQSDRIKTLETSHLEIKERMMLLDKDLMIKALELENCQNELAKSTRNEDLILEMTVKLKDSTLLCETIQNRLMKSLSSEAFYKTELTLLGEEKRKLTSALEGQQEKVSFLEKHIEELKEDIIILEDNLNAKSSELQNSKEQLSSHCEVSDGNTSESLNFLVENCWRLLCSFEEKCPTSNLGHMQKKNSSFIKTTKFSELDVKIWASNILECIHLLENAVISYFDKYKFLWAYHLLSHEVLEKSKMNAISLYRIFTLMQGQKAILFFILSISKIKSVSQHLNFLSVLAKSDCFYGEESITIDNFLGNILKMLFLHHKHILHCTAKNLHKCLQNLKQPVSFLESHKNINSCNNHIIITLDTKYLLYEHKISSCFSKRNSRLACQENQFLMWDSTDEKQIKDVLQKLSVKEVSKVLNFYAVSKYNALDFVSINFEALQSVIFLFLHKYNQAKGVEILEELIQWANFKNFLNDCLKPMYVNIKEIPCAFETAGLKRTCVEQIEVENNVSKHEASLIGLITEEEKRSLALKLGNSANKNESCIKCLALIKEKMTLELALSKEKDTQKSLNSTIEEIEQDLSDTFMHKCQLQNVIIEIGKMFDRYTKISIDSNLFSETQFSSEFFSKTCLCENCVKQDCEITHSNNILSTETFALWINKLIEQYSKMKSEKEELLKIKSRETVGCNSEGSVEISEELQKLEAEESGFAVFVEQFKEKVQMCDVLKLEITSQEEKIKTMQETIKSQKEILENTCLLSKTYEKEIAKLESKIRKYELTESHEPVLIDEREKKIVDLLKEVKDLEKSNDTLNLNIEKMEQQIRTLSVLKDKLDEEVSKLSSELSKKVLDIETWKDMYETEKYSKAKLAREIQQLEIEKIELEEKLIQFEIQNDEMEQDESILKKLQQEHQTCELSISNLKNMCETEKKYSSELISKLEQLEIEKIELEEKLIQFEILNNDMEQDVINLKKLQQEHQTCELAISNWKNKYETEKKSALELTSKVQELEIDLKEKLQLQIVNDDLKQKVTTLKNLQKEHETQTLDTVTWKDKYETEKKSTSELMNKMEQLDIEKVQLEQNFKSLQIVNDSLEQDLTIFKNLQQDIEVQKLDASTFKDLYETEKNSTLQLTIKLQQLEKENIKLEEKLKQLQIVNDSLKQDVSTLKILQREHEHTLLAKNHTLKEKDHIIQMLQEKMKEIESNNIHDWEKFNELQNLRAQLEKMSENVSCLEKKVQEVESENMSCQKSLNEGVNERDELKIKIDSLKQNVDKLIQDLELQKQTNLELNKQLDIAKISLLKESELHRHAETEIKIQKETINSLNSSLEQNLHKISEMETQILIMKNENKKLLDNESISKQVILDLKKDICSSTHSLEELQSKYSELSNENNALLEMKREISSVSENVKMKQVKKFTENIFNLIEEIVKDFSGSPLTEQIKNDINSIKRILRQGSDFSNIEEISENICNDLKSFFENNLRNTEEELKIYNLIGAISDSVNYVGQFVDSVSDNDSPTTLHFADNTVNVTFNETFSANLIEKTRVSHGQILKDLHQTQELIESYFSALKTVVIRQADNCKDLKFKLDQAMSRTSIESGECTNNCVPKWKFKLVRVSAHRWEQEANKVQKSYNVLKENINVLEEKLKAQSEKINSLEKEKVKSELEFNQRIKSLEEENKRLDEEAEELSEDFKKLELSENMDKLKLYETIDALKQKLEESTRECNQLKTSGISK